MTKHLLTLSIIFMVVGCKDTEQQYTEKAIEYHDRVIMERVYGNQDSAYKYDLLYMHYRDLADSCYSVKKLKEFNKKYRQ